MVSTTDASKNEKIEKIKTRVPPVDIIRESVYGAGTLKKKEPQKKVVFFAKSQKKAHILRDELAHDVDSEKVCWKRSVHISHLTVIQTRTVPFVCD